MFIEVNQGFITVVPQHEKHVQRSLRPARRLRKSYRRVGWKRFALQSDGNNGVT